jgi:hypothetical protein
MDHVAIMNNKLGLIEKILDGTKSIESRWYRQKNLPWNRIQTGQEVYFKYSGGPVIAKAKVEKVLQFENLTKKKVKEIVDEFGGDGKIALMKTSDLSWADMKKYCILIFLKNPKRVIPFAINKQGFGSAVAWLTVPDITAIKR